MEYYPFNRHHLLRALEWLDRIAPGSSDALGIATVTHDMERAFPGPDQPTFTSLVDSDYLRAHSKRSARIVGAWLRERHADSSLVAEVERLILAHEFGGWREAALLQAADSLSFLETNIDLLLGFAQSGWLSANEVRKKFEYAYDRIRPPHVKVLAAPMRAAAVARLDAWEAGRRTSRRDARLSVRPGADLPQRRSLNRCCSESMTNTVYLFDRPNIQP
jgi:hypothetical protein